MTVKNRLLNNEAQILFTAIMLDSVLDREDAVDRLHYIYSKQAIEADALRLLVESGKLTAAEYRMITEQ